MDARAAAQRVRDVLCDALHNYEPRSLWERLLRALLLSACSRE